MEVSTNDAGGVGTNAPVRYVHHGSLAVDRTIDTDFRKAESYLRRDGTMRHILNDLERGRAITTIRGDSIAMDRYSPSMRRVDWDPHRAARFAGGGRQSPALVLGHELAHADIDRKLQARFGTTADARYDDTEERRVIVGAETHAARSLGESVRTDHNGTLFAVRSATSRF